MDSKPETVKGFGARMKWVGHINQTSETAWKNKGRSFTGRYKGRVTDHAPSVKHDSHLFSILVRLRDKLKPATVLVKTLLNKEHGASALYSSFEPQPDWL